MLSTPEERHPGRRTAAATALPWASAPRGAFPAPPAGGPGRGGAGLRVIGIDPGIATCGYAVVESTPPAAAGTVRRRYAAVAWGALRPPGEGPARLAALHDGIAALLAEHAPDAAAVEQLFHTRNVRTASEVGQARGVALLACVESAVPVAEYTPTAVKLAVAGYGGADKQQVRRMVTVQLGLPRPPSPDDAADALGLCLCHLAGEGLRGRQAEAVARRAGLAARP